MERQRWIDFRQLKDDIAIEQVFQHYGLSFRKTGQSEVRGQCPLPTHQSTDSKDSFGASIAKDVFSCQSESCIEGRGGKVGGNILDFVSWMEGCTIREAALKLQDWFSIDEVARGLDNGNGNGSSGTNEPLKLTLEGIDASHPYIVQRGIKPKTAKTFGIGLYSGEGSLSGRIVFPIHNESDELVAYCGRSLEDVEPRYLMPSGFRKSLVIFNLHRALKTSKTVIVVEGFFACLWLHQAGYPNTVALMGTSLSPMQEDLLLAGFDHVVLMLDGNDAGRRGNAKAADRLMRKVFVRVVELPDEAQPDSLSAEEIQGSLDFLETSNR